MPHGNECIKSLSSRREHLSNTDARRFDLTREADVRHRAPATVHYRVLSTNIRFSNDCSTRSEASRRTIIENNRKQRLLKNEERSLLSPFDEIFLGESTARRIKTGEGKSRTRHRQFSGGNGVIHDWEKGFRNNWFGLLKTRQRFPSCGQRSKGVTACVLSEVYAPFGRTPWPGLRPPFLLLDFRQRVAREAGRQRSERFRI